MPLNQNNITNPLSQGARIPLAKQFVDGIRERFEKCKQKLNFTDARVVMDSFPQHPASKCMVRELASTVSSYKFGDSFNTSKVTKQREVLYSYGFIAISPIRYIRTYSDNAFEIFNYVEIHTSQKIEVFLYESKQFKSSGQGYFFDSHYHFSAVKECLPLSEPIGSTVIHDSFENLLIERIANNLANSQITLADFIYISMNPNREFLSTILAYAILACNMDRFDKFRQDSNVPFLLVIDCSSIKDNEDYPEILRYIKRVHAACYMPDGSYADGFAPKKAKDYEAYIDQYYLSRRLTLIEAADGIKVDDAFPKFYSMINNSVFGKKQYPYKSLPLIITTEGEKYPDQYFFKFDAKNIEWDNEVVQKSLPFILEILTHIIQSAGVKINKVIQSPVLLQYASNVELTSIDSSVKRAKDKLYLARVIAASVFYIGKEKIESTKYTINNFVNHILFEKKHSHVNKIIPEIFVTMESTIDSLFRCIVEDLDCGNVFTDTPPQSKTDLSEVRYAFQQGDLLCFTRESESNNCLDTLEKYVNKKELLTEKLDTDVIWNELKKSDYQGLTEKNNKSNYHKYTVKEVLSIQTYAFHISAIKTYLAQHEVSGLIESDRS